MKKYNKSEIMKRAWELVKKAGMTISSGLKKAWIEAKKGIKKVENKEEVLKIIKRRHIRLEKKIIDGVEKEMIAISKTQVRYKSKEEIDFVKKNRIQIIETIKRREKFANDFVKLYKDAWHNTCVERYSNQIEEAKRTEKNVYCDTYSSGYNDIVLDLYVKPNGVFYEVENRVL